jgi:hypothetical protein
LRIVSWKSRNSCGSEYVVGASVAVAIAGRLSSDAG